MNERTRNGKPFSQDALGFLFCLVGGFFAVSIVLFVRGQEPKPGLVSAMTWPVLELIAVLGTGAGLFLSLGLAALGAVLFLRSDAFAPLRPLLAIFFGALGVASILGALGFGGEALAASWLPGLVPGLVGRVLAFVLGVPLAWLGWTLVAERAPRRTELAPRVGLAGRHDVAAGVSPAEAALLVSEPRAPAARPAPRRDGPVPLREETIRPYAPREAPPGESRASRIEAPVRPVRAVEAPPAVPVPAVPSVPFSKAAELVAGASEPVSGLTPPAPTWEGVSEESTEEAELADALEEELEELEGEREEEAEEEAAAEETAEAAAEHLGATLSEEFETEEEELEEEEAEDEAGAVRAVAPATRSAALPPASWEQAGLFDEQEALEVEEEAPAPPAKVELTAPFDFEASEPKKPAHEPDAPDEGDRSILTPVRAPATTRAKDEADGEEGEEREEEPVVVLAPALPSVPTAAAAVPAPAPPPAAAPEPVLARDESERWSQLVFDAGCTILEQQRVTVSLLERRFSIDFDQACRVLDELQQAGLIGPYMGGRTRDILLTREQWLPHAPHAS